MLVLTLCDWFSYSASASDSDNLVGVVSEIRTLFSLDHKLYASDHNSDSNSVASVNQP